MGDFTCRTFIVDDDGAGRECGKTFDSLKALRTHEKSHVLRRCKFCGTEVSNNGHAQHEAACTEKPDALPWEVWDDLLADLVIHAEDIPSDAVCVVSVGDEGARFLTIPAALKVVERTLARGVSMSVIPSELLQRPETVARWRRKQLGPDPEPVTPPEPEPDRGLDDQLLPGAPWDLIQ